MHTHTKYRTKWFRFWYGVEWEKGVLFKLLQEYSEIFSGKQVGFARVAAVYRQRWILIECVQIIRRNLKHF